MTQSVWFYIIDFFVVLFAIVVGDSLMEIWKEWRYKDLDINCDNCNNPVKLARTPDKKRYLCETCMPAYITEHFPEMDPAAFTKSFRKRKIKRRKK